VCRRVIHVVDVNKVSVATITDEDVKKFKVEQSKE
jgi:hypothetical protein